MPARKPKARQATPAARRGAAKKSGRMPRMAPSIAEALSGSTLVENFVKRDRKKVAFWFESLDAPTVEVRFGDLLDRVRREARGLRALGTVSGDRILLVLPTSVEFVSGFWGILVAGATPVPAYPPAGLHQLASFSANLARMVRASKARLVIVPGILRDLLTGEQAQPGGARLVTPEEVFEAGAGREKLPPGPKPEDLALIQFSSGSTGEPRGVCLTHANVMANIRAFLSRLGAGPRDSCATWLPLYHDMGLIGTLLGPLMCGRPVTLVSPVDFLRQPAIWLRAISKHRATISVAPQFAYNLCVRKVELEDLKGVDLSPLRVILNGAEPIYADGIAAFEKKFRRVGLRSGVVTPCYGLAEATLAAAMQAPGRKLRLTRLPAAGSKRAANGNGAPDIVACGPPMDGVEIKIRNLDGQDVPDGTEGEICIRGASVCTGVLGENGVSRITDAEGWLRSGDLGFLDHGELCVTGRLKDLIIIGGRNLYPHDLEAVAGEVDGLRPGRVVAFGVREPEKATEGLVIVAESTQADSHDAALCVGRLRRLLLDRFGIAPHDTVLVKRGQIPLTTSGKLRRSETKNVYQRGGFGDALFRVLGA
jgi:acyl-CoA synthetase (AMP-forming)/AMP-acid ligase II